MELDKAFYKKNFFALDRYRVSAQKRSEAGPEENEASVKILVPARAAKDRIDARYYAEYQPEDAGSVALYASSAGNGVVDALDGALRKLLVPVYPFIEDIRLIRYTVSTTSFKEGTSSEVEVFILATNNAGKLYFSEVCSSSVIEASFFALANIYNRYFGDEVASKGKNGKTIKRKSKKKVKRK